MLKLKKLLQLGVITSLLAGSIFTFTGCSQNAEYDSLKLDSLEYSYVIGEDEQTLEDSLANLLTRETGKTVYSVNVIDLEVAQDKAKSYLLLEAKAVFDVAKGLQKCNICFEIDDEIYQKIGEKLTEVIHSNASGYNSQEPSHENLFSYKYKAGLIEDVSAALEKRHTKVLAIYNIDDKNYEYRLNTPTAQTQSSLIEEEAQLQ
ncbi:MAG: hypothetical protein J6A28_02740 [Clostridia bacterium]|nr:hypothetical protein [Clostridia bacterium]